MAAKSEPQIWRSADIHRRMTRFCHRFDSRVGHLLDSVTGARAAAERGDVLFGTIDSFLIWRLTGGRRHLTDASNA
ncbi:MAG: hypothetical protein HC838_15660, partial [Spirulinaceae cyanobacterium RM2_2_10]|nr:hypothetical protein [Spirulinaceae cyanobacterium RM2_2_10]